MTRVVAVGVLLAGLALEGTAHADAVVDEGVRRYAAADFPGALAAFDRAEAASDLDRDEAATLLLTRALVLFAVDRAADAERDLLRLASFAPDHPLGPDVPPRAREAFARARLTASRPVAARVRVDRVGARARAVPSVSDDVAGIVREVRISMRVGAGAWETTSAASLEREARATDRVQARVEAVGPGGAVVASSTATLDAPGASPVGREPAPIAPTSRGRDEPASSDAWPWIAAGVGAVAVAAIVTVLVVAASSAGPTPVEPPGITVGSLSP